ncbi:MAG: diguanylate cyclase [Peptostreptococcaceae bacterium]|nr:diguanylate cyclase [Peptostreptococcaceae bacterium]
MGIYIVFQDRKAALNRTFFMMNLSFAIYAIGSAFLLVAPDKDSCDLWIKILAIGAFSFPSIGLHFFLIFSERKKLLKKLWVYILIYLPFFVLLIFELTSNFYAKDYVFTNYGWLVITRNDSVIFWLYNLYYTLYLSVGILTAFFWLRKADSVKKKKQGNLIIIFGLFSLLLSSLLYTISLFNHNIPNFATITVVLWVPGFLYAIVKYKMMLITPSMAANQILETIKESVIIVDKKGGIIITNKETNTLLGYTNDELKGKPLGTLFPYDENFTNENIQNLFAKCPIQNMETNFVSKNNESIPVIFSASEFRDSNGFLLGYIAATRDIINLKEAEKRLSHLAHHDSLTNLPNRLLFVDRFNQEVAKAKRYKTNIAVVMIDLDHFKEVNDNYGHDFGDLLLIEVSNRLKTSIRQCDSIARFGGDEFVILLSNLKDINEFEPTANRIIDNVSKPFLIDSKEFHITISMGVSVYPINGTNLDILLKYADMAMYSVKECGRNNYELFTPVTDLMDKKL